VKKRKKISFKKILSGKSPKEKETTANEIKTPEKEPITQVKPVEKKEVVYTQKAQEKKEVAQKIEKPKESAATPKKQKPGRKREEIMIVKVGKEFYGIPLSNIEEIKREIKLTRTPQLSLFLSGIAEIRESIIPVVNFAQLLGIEKEISSAKKIPIIVVEISGQLVGFQVSEIVEIVEIHKDEILTLPDIFPPQLFSGGYTYKSSVVGVLNVESLLKGTQIQSFKEKIDEVIK